jgi:hypothetical protein
MLTCMNRRLLRLQKSTDESTWGMGVELGAVGPGLTSTSLEEDKGTAKGYKNWSSSVFRSQQMRAPGEWECS